MLPETGRQRSKVNRIWHLGPPRNERIASHWALSVDGRPDLELAIDRCCTSTFLGEIFLSLLCMFEWPLLEAESRISTPALAIRICPDLIGQQRRAS